MAEFFTKTRIKNLIIAVALVVLGIIFCALNGRVYDFISVLGYICGGVLIALGIILMLMYFINFKKETNSSNFISGGFAFVLGLVFVISQGMFVVTLLILSVGFGLCAFGIVYMAKGFEKLRIANKNIWKEMLYGLISFAFGLVLLILMMIESDISIIYMGISLILAGLCLILFTCFKDKIVVKLEKSPASEKAEEKKEDKKEVKAEEKKEEKMEKNATVKKAKTTKKSK